MLKQPPFPCAQTCPAHVSAAWGLLSVFQLVLWVRLARAVLQLVKNLQLYLGKKHRSWEICFCGRKKKIRGESLFESFHYKMRGGAPWAGSSLLINQCKGGGNSGTSPCSALLIPAGFHLEMEKKIWISPHFIPPKSGELRIKKPFLKANLRTWKRERRRQRKGWLVKKAFSEQETKNPAQVCYWSPVSTQLRNCFLEGAEPQNIINILILQLKAFLK